MKELRPTIEELFGLPSTPEKQPVAEKKDFFNTAKAAEAYIVDKDLAGMEVLPIYNHDDEHHPSVKGYGLFPVSQAKQDRNTRPVSAPSVIEVTGLRSDLMTHEFPPYRYAWGRYYPAGSSGLISEGGVGKSTLSLSQQLHGAAGGKEYLGAPTLAGLYIYISCEDLVEVVERRAQRIMRTFIPEERALALANFKIIDGVGRGLQFVMTANGMTGISPNVDRIIAAIREAADGREVVHVAVDTVSRVNGGIENATEVMSAVEQAASRISQAFDCACTLLHHTSKAVAREGVADAHAGRGGSSFGDNLRSVLRLMPLTWPMVQREKLDGLDRVSVERGDVLKLVHAKLNQDRKSDPIYLQRTANGLLERIEPTVRSDVQTADAEMQSLVKWFNGERKAQPFTISCARDAWLKWTKMTRRSATVFLEDSVREGRLVEQGASKGKPTYVPSADALTGQVHSDDEGWVD